MIDPKLSIKLSHSDRLVLIPAAGLGTRVNQEDSKELLARPSTGEPLISQSIRGAWSADALPHVILRKEKQKLREYLASFSADSSKLSIQEISSSREWPDTLLMSEPYWRTYNLIYLPDIEFKPLNIVSELFRLLEAKDLDVVFAGREVYDRNLWGIVNKQSETKLQEEIQFCEKPREGQSNWAWGFVGFRKDAGRKLLENLLASTFDHQWKKLSLKSMYLDLIELTDLTRP